MDFWREPVLQKNSQFGVEQLCNQSSMQTNISQQTAMVDALLFSLSLLIQSWIILAVVRLQSRLRKVSKSETELLGPSLSYFGGKTNKLCFTANIWWGVVKILGYSAVLVLTLLSLSATTPTMFSQTPNFILLTSFVSVVRQLIDFSSEKLPVNK